MSQVVWLSAGAVVLGFVVWCFLKMLTRKKKDKE